MLIDLERNDLGRVCEAGTVEVDEMMVLESYAHVHHIVSNVRGRLRGDVTPGAAIAAVFPGGTITGCPKVRCMEIIDELEYSPRGAYTGSFGYLNRDGSLDLNILIRTMVKHGDQVTFRAGAGIVADSDPQAELDEAVIDIMGATDIFDNVQATTEGEQFCGMFHGVGKLANFALIADNDPVIFPNGFILKNVGALLGQSLLNAGNGLCGFFTFAHEKTQVQVVFCIIIV